MKRLLVCDSSHLDEKTAHDFGAAFLPLIIQINGKTYEDYGQTSLRDELIESLKNFDDVKTSMMPFGKFEEKVIQWSKEYDEIYFFGISKGISSQYSALKPLEDDYPKLTVIDTRNITTSGWVLIQKIKKLLDSNAPKQMILDCVQDYVNDREFCLIVNNLEHLRRGGRINPAIAALGKMLKIKPIIKLEPDGSLGKFGKARTIGGCVKDIVKAFNKKFPDFKHNLDKYTIYYVESGLNLEMDKQILLALQKEIPGIKNNIHKALLPNVIMTHTGYEMGIIGVIRNE